jgi:hypothetical protein
MRPGITIEPEAAIDLTPAAERGPCPPIASDQHIANGEVRNLRVHCDDGAAPDERLNPVFRLHDRVLHMQEGRYPSPGHLNKHVLRQIISD